MPRTKKIVPRRCALKHLKGARWVVDLGKIGGKRVRRFFSLRDDAATFAEMESAKLREHGESAVGFSHAKRVIFEDVERRLAAVGATMSQAADYFLKHHKPLASAMTLVQLLDAAVLAKELAGLRKRYIQQFACSCRSFIGGRETVCAHEVVREDVKAWVLGSGFAPKTQRTYLGDVRSLFQHGIEAGCVLVNPVAGADGFIKLDELADGEITCFDVEVCRRLLWTALFAPAPGKRRENDGRWSAITVPLGFRPLLGYVVAAMFGMVRPEEVKRTLLKRVDVREGTLVVTAQSAKTSKRRVVQLDRVAVIWLRLWQRLCPGAELVPKNFRRRFEALREAAGIVDWPHDILRHTGASYHYALHQNRSLLQAMLGHSEDEDTLDRHYRAVLTLSDRPVGKKAAVEFWRMTPRLVRLSGV